MHCLREHDRPLGLWMTRSDVTDSFLGIMTRNKTGGFLVEREDFVGRGKFLLDTREKAFNLRLIHGVRC
jgi:hypothetical protein